MKNTTLFLWIVGVAVLLFMGTAVGSGMKSYDRAITQEFQKLHTEIQAAHAEVIALREEAEKTRQEVVEVKAQMEAEAQEFEKRVQDIQKDYADKIEQAKREAAVAVEAVKSENSGLKAQIAAGQEMVQALRDQISALREQVKAQQTPPAPLQTESEISDEEEGTLEEPPPFSTLKVQSDFIPAHRKETKSMSESNNQPEFNHTQETFEFLWGNASWTIDDLWDAGDLTSEYGIYADSVVGLLMALAVAQPHEYNIKRVETALATWNEDMRRNFFEFRRDGDDDPYFNTIPPELLKRWRNCPYKGPEPVDSRFMVVCLTDGVDMAHMGLAYTIQEAKRAIAQALGVPFSRRHPELLPYPAEVSFAALKEALLQDATFQWYITEVKDSGEQIPLSYDDPRLS